MSDLNVNQNVTVTHQFSGGDPFAEAAASFSAMVGKLENIASSLGKSSAGTTQTIDESKAGDTTKNQNQKTPSQQNILSPIDTLNVKINDLIKAITDNKPFNATALNSKNPLRSVEELRQINEISLDKKAKSKAIDLQSLQDVAEFKKSQKPTTEDLELEQEKKSQQTWRKIGRGMALGGATAAVYQAGSVGATFGGEYNALNVSASNYGGFAIGQYNKQVDALTGIASTGISSVTMSLAAAAAASGAGIPAAGLIMAGGAALNYGAQYFGGKSKAEHELAVNEDIKSWRLRSAGLSGASNQQIAGGGALSEFQKAMRTKENAAYNTDSVPVFLSARRDIVGGMSAVKQASYSTATQILAQKMGVDNVNLSRTVSNTSAITGRSTDQVMANMQSDFNVYGGDPLANQNKINALMMSASMSEAQARGLVNRYQYNDAMLQNKVNDTTVTPMNRFKASIYGTIYKNMTGLDIDSAEAKKRFQAAGRSKNGSPNPEFAIYEQGMQARGQNMWAADIGGNRGTTPNQAATSSVESQPISMGDYAQTMISALSATILNVRIVEGDTQHTAAQPSTSGNNFTSQNKSYPAYQPAKNSTSQSSSKIKTPEIEKDALMKGLIINGKQV